MGQGPDWSGSCFWLCCYPHFTSDFTEARVQQKLSRKTSPSKKVRWGVALFVSFQWGPQVLGYISEHLELQTPAFHWEIIDIHTRECSQVFMPCVSFLWGPQGALIVHWAGLTRKSIWATSTGRDQGFLNLAPATFSPLCPLCSIMFCKKDKDKDSHLKVEESPDVMDIFKPITEAVLQRQAHEI